MANIYSGRRSDNNEEVVGTVLHIKGTPIHFIIPNQELNRLIITDSRGEEIKINAHRVSQESLQPLYLQEDIKKLDEALIDIMKDISNGVTNMEYYHSRLAAIEKGLWQIK